MSLKAAVQMPKTDREYQKWCRDSYDLRVMSGTGSPASVVVANRGTIYMRTDGGASTTMYIKETGDGLSSGWRAV